MTDKRTLRARMRAARLAFPPVPLPVPPEFAARLRAGMVVAGYRPMPGEADPAPLERAAEAAGCVLALPHLTDRGEPMRFRRWDGELVQGPYGIGQPADDAPDVAPDIILTPLVAFERSGARLGQGAGFYDRAFAGHAAAWRVGVAWSMQEHLCIPTDPWDVPLHAIVTEKEWITP